MKDNELRQKVLNISKKKVGLNKICNELNLSKYEVMGLIKELQEKGINITIQKSDDDIYLINQGDIDYNQENTYSFDTNEKNEFKFIAISDTGFGSKYEQKSLLYKIYELGNSMGYHNVILCGNISAGLYKLTDVYADDNFVDDTLGQIKYISKEYPYIKGMKTYFISGKEDDKHLQNKISIGKRISNLRDDMIYLGDNSCDIKIDNAKMQIMSNKLSKTYTLSYRLQQQINSYRSEDKPDILLYGGLLQMEKLTYRQIHGFSIPSMMATTRYMNDKRYPNTIGALFMTVKTKDNKKEKGNFKSVDAIFKPIYTTDKEDYKKSITKTLKKGGMKYGK